jgi:hypothetical protein
MTKKTPDELLAGADAKTLQTILERYYAELEADEEHAIEQRRHKLRRQHKSLGVPVKRRA